MSRKKLTIVENLGFSQRLIELCGTSEPSEVQRLLNISYQAAKNYLQGRFPDPKVLINISEKTSCSIHWLLTGRGPRKVKLHKSAKHKQETFELIKTTELESLIRKISLEEISKLTAQENKIDQKETVVTLISEDILEEKVIAEKIKVA